MSSETEQNNIQQENSQRTVSKNGLKIFGYVAPWWVVLLVTVILIYILRILYVDGYFKSISGKSNSTGAGVSVLTEDTPEEIRKLIGGSIRWN